MSYPKYPIFLLIAPQRQKTVSKQSIIYKLFYCIFKPRQIQSLDQLKNCLYYVLPFLSFYRIFLNQIIDLQFHDKYITCFRYLSIHTIDFDLYLSNFVLWIFVKLWDNCNAGQKSSGKNNIGQNFYAIINIKFMVMQTEIQFQDLSFIDFVKENQRKNSFDFQLDMFLGISPLPTYMQEEITEQKIGEIELTRKNSIKTESQQTNVQETHGDDGYSPETESHQCKIKTSNHHNFQKHTVTALRDLVKIDQLRNLCCDDQTTKVTICLWKDFLKIKGKSIMTKKFLSILFRSDIHSVSLLKPYGFKQLFSQFKQGEILAAKNELRRLVISYFFSQKNINEHLEKRQVKRKQEFRLYLINFRTQLEKANIKKRISKESSDWIVDNAKIFDCLN